MFENMDIEKTERVKDATRSLTQKINAIGENMELLKQVITDAAKVTGRNRNVQNRLSSLEEELDELCPKVEEETRKFLKMMETVRGMIDGGLKWYTCMDIEIDGRSGVKRSRKRRRCMDD